MKYLSMFTFFRIGLSHRNPLAGHFGTVCVLPGQRNLRAAQTMPRRGLIALFRAHHTQSFLQSHETFCLNSGISLAILQFGLTSIT